jgi:hypothetical protein
MILVILVFSVYSISSQTVGRVLRGGAVVPRGYLGICLCEVHICFERNMVGTLLVLNISCSVLPQNISEFYDMCGSGGLT